MKSFGTFVGSIVVGLGIGLAVTAVLWSITGNDKTASAIGTGLWLTSSFVIHAYASIWAVSAGVIRLESGDRSNERFRRKLRTAEIRYALIFGAIGGALVHSIGASWYLPVVVGGVLAMLGGFLGYVKRRYERIGSH